jgi:hypothetical protein
MKIPREYSPANFTPEQLNMTRAQYLAWSVRSADAPNLSDEDFLLWHGEVMAGYPKLATDEEWMAIVIRLREIKQ